MENQKVTVGSELGPEIMLHVSPTSVRAPVAENGVELEAIDGGIVQEDMEEPVKVRSKTKLAAVLVALMLSIFIAALDQTIIATAIPTITSALHSASGYVWIGGAYLLSNAAFVPIWAKFSDIWGRKPILLSAVTLFSIASTICANAIDMRMLIAGRTLQGVAGGGLFQMVMIIISDLFSVRERSLFVGLLETMWAIAGAVGPILGGTFTEKLSWRWCFWINLPVCGTAFILLFWFLDVHNPRTSAKDGIKAVDWAGSLSILALTVMVLLGLEFGGATFPWKSPQVLCLIIFGALMSGAFIYSEKRLAKYPVMPLSLFKNRSNVACLTVCALHGMVYIGGEFYLPLYFQSARQASPLESGILVLPITIVEALVGMGVGIFIHRTGHYLELIYIGTIILTIGSGLYIHFTPISSIPTIIGFQILTGFGAGLLFQAPLLAIQAIVPPSQVATATSTFGFIRNISTALSVVLGGVIFQNSMDLQIPSLSSPPNNIPRNVTELLSGGSAAANVGVVTLIGDEAQKMVVKEAFAWSLRNMWIFYTALAGLTIFAAAFIDRHVLDEVHVETKTGIPSEK